MKEFEINQYGISIVKCCASCKYKDQTRWNHLRSCRKGFGTNNMKFCCGEGWSMADGLENAGKGDGRIKKYDYLLFAAEFGAHRSKEWVNKHGSKYLVK